MGYNKTVGEYPSSDEKHQIKYYVYRPDGIPSAVLQISHGMSEYIERYEKEGFVSALTDAGFIVCGNDHLGHGQSVNDEGELGDFENYENLVCDLHTLNGIIKKTYRSLPYILFGYSMGSFAVRDYMTKYDDIDGAIICGTSAGNQPIGMADFIASLIEKLKGSNHRSGFLKKLVFRGYNSAFSKENDEISWLLADIEARKRYKEDPLCGFNFTARAYRELFSLLSSVSSTEWAGKLPLHIPVYLISGEDDPVGENGEGIKELYSRLEDVELTELKMKLYKNGRHEIHNDYLKNEVYEDIIAWIKEVSDGVVACRQLDSLQYGRVDFS